MNRLRSLISKGKINTMSAMSTKDICVVCFNKEATYTCIPCAHQVLCVDCVSIFNERFETCPICRVKFSNLPKMNKILFFEDTSYKDKK